MKTGIIVAGLIAAFAVVSARSAEAPSQNGVPSGYRGVAVPLSGDQVAFLKKGDRVDAMVTFEAKMKGNVKEKVTATILQNVLVLDIIKPAKLEEKGVVQLALNPNESQYVALSLRQGDLVLSLRAESDKKLAPMEMASFRKLFN
ncbi:MAG: RcpC/CpaB family pilus assembly protein [Elusimicrobia bacterium]|nr:RcpC/CpaB family pilus assembly protein [Elusimicrobiota bacterium]